MPGFSYIIIIFPGFCTDVQVFCLTDNSYGYVPLLEDSEKRKNNLTLDEPHDKVKLGTLRDKQSKVGSAVRLALKRVRLHRLTMYLVCMLPQFEWVGHGKKVGNIFPNIASAETNI